VECNAKHASRGMPPQETIKQILKYCNVETNACEDETIIIKRMHKVDDSAQEYSI